MVNAPEYDVVVVGSGVSGLIAAIACAQSGLSVIVLEKTEFLGGCSSWSYSATWVPGSDAGIAAGIEEDAAAVAEYMEYLGGGENDRARTSVLLANLQATFRFLSMIGVEFELLHGVSDVLYGKAPGASKEGRTLQAAPMLGAELGALRDLLRTPPGTEWRLRKSDLVMLSPEEVTAKMTAAIAADQLAQGVAVVGRLVRAASLAGVRLQLCADVTALLSADARVHGVELSDGSTVLGKRAVLLATGTYLANEQMVAEFDGLPEFRSIHPDIASGDGIKLGLKAGAAIGRIANNLSMNVGYDDPATMHLPLQAAIIELPRAHVIMVNADGQRFGNENTFQDYATAIRAYDSKTRRMKNLPCWMVFDSNYVERWGFANHPPGSAPDWAPRAPDISALAEKVGIDPAGLNATIERFNQFAETGTDRDFGRAPIWAMAPTGGTGKNPGLAAIERPPFFAVRLRPSLQGGTVGLKGDTKSRVLDWEGNPVPGLYAAGDVVLHDELGTGYQAGLTYASCLTFGYLAAQAIKGV